MIEGLGKAKEMSGGTVTDATTGTSSLARRERGDATGMVPGCVTAGHPGCLRLTLVFHIVHHPCRASYSTPVEYKWTRHGLDGSDCTAESSAGMDGWQRCSYDGPYDTIRVFAQTRTMTP
jgi:hypothetical protein